MPADRDKPNRDTSKQEKEVDPKPDEPFWDESQATSDEDVRRDTFGPSRQRDLRQTYS